MKDKFGNQITIKVFFQKWKEGIQQITPLQQTKINLLGISLMLAGVIIGLVTTFITRTWWLFIVLLGSLLLVCVNFLANLQKYLAYKKINEQIKGGANEQESTN